MVRLMATAINSPSIIQNGKNNSLKACERKKKKNDSITEDEQSLVINSLALCWMHTDKATEADGV